MPVLGRDPRTHVFRDLHEHPDDETLPGIVVLRLDSSLFFATAEALEDRVRDLLDRGDLQRALVLDLEGVNAIDSQGAAKVDELHQLLSERGIVLHLARVKPWVRRVLEADVAVARIGTDHIHATIPAAVGCRPRPPTAAPPR